MNSGGKEVLVALIVAAFILASVDVLVVQGGTLTREEAIEISRNSELVRSLLEDADRYTLEVHHLNKTQSGEDCGVWDIVWYIHPNGAVSAFAYVVSHSIDDGTGEILCETSSSIR